jgi:uncharacterized protein
MGQSETTILNDLKQAMLNKEPQKVSVLRLVVASIKNKTIELNKELSDQEVTEILKKEAKKRQESVDIYRKAGREELASKEEAEIKVIKAYLPEEMSRDEIVKVVLKLKTEGKVTADFGLAMRAVLSELKGQADGKTVAEVVRQNL